MNINATFFVQALNFFIVYWMLRLFLFKPVIAAIERENDETNSLLGIINQQQKSLEIQEKERQRHWYICQEYFLTHQPYKQNGLIPSTAFSQKNDALVPPLSTESLATTVIDIQNIIEKKIKHVH